MLCEQISRVAKARSNSNSISIPPTQDVTLQGLWASYYRYVLAHLAILNKCIRGEGGRYGGRDRVFYCISRLMYFDMMVETSSACQAHINGFFAYVRKMGGVRAVLSLAQPPMQSFQAVLT